MDSVTIMNSWSSTVTMVTREQMENSGTACCFALKKMTSPHFKRVSTSNTLHDKHLVLYKVSERCKTIQNTIQTPTFCDKVSERCVSEQFIFAISLIFLLEWCYGKIKRNKKRQAICFVPSFCCCVFTALIVASTQTDAESIYLYY